MKCNKCKGNYKRVLLSFLNHRNDLESTALFNPLAPRTLKWNKKVVNKIVTNCL